MEEGGVGKGPVCVGGSRERVRHSAERGFEDGAEGEALKLSEPRSSSYFNSYVSFYYEQKSCYVPSVPFCPASS